MTEREDQRSGEQSETDRLRRELRAVAAVNRQLRAELDGSSQRAISPPGGTAPSSGTARDPEGAGAFKSSITGGGPASSGVDRIEVVQGPTGIVYLIEGGNVHRIGSNVVAAALEEVFGFRRPIDTDELARYVTAPTIEVYCNEAGRTFVVVAGRRMPVEGLPVVRDAPPGLEATLEAGEKLNVNHAIVARSLYARALRGQQQMAWLQQKAKSPRVVVKKVQGRLRRP